MEGNYYCHHENASSHSPAPNHLSSSTPSPRELPEPVISSSSIKYLSEDGLKLTIRRNVMDTIADDEMRTKEDLPNPGKDEEDVKKKNNGADKNRAAENGDYDGSGNESDEGSIYEVEKILDAEVRDDDTYYLVKWKGYAPEYDSWEPEANLESARECIKAFQNSLKGKKKLGAKDMAALFLDLRRLQFARSLLIEWRQEMRGSDDARVPDLREEGATVQDEQPPGSSSQSQASTPVSDKKKRGRPSKGSAKKKETPSRAAKNTSPSKSTTRSRRGEPRVEPDEENEPESDDDNDKEGSYAPEERRGRRGGKKATQSTEKLESPKFTGSSTQQRRSLLATTHRSNWLDMDSDDDEESDKEKTPKGTDKELKPKAEPPSRAEKRSVERFESPAPTKKLKKNDTRASTSTREESTTITSSNGVPQPGFDGRVQVVGVAKLSGQKWVAIREMGGPERLITIKEAFEKNAWGLVEFLLDRAKYE